MENKILIFKDPEKFLIFMEQLEKAYNESQEQKGNKANDKRSVKE